MKVRRSWLQIRFAFLDTFGITRCFDPQRSPVLDVLI